MTSKLERIRAALDAATPGEWYWKGRVGDANSDATVGYDRLQTDDDDIISWRKTAWVAVNEADAHLIANAPDDLRALLAVAEAAAGFTDVFNESRIDASQEFYDAYEAMFVACKALTADDGSGEGG